MPARTIAVVGATGNQGSGTVSALLAQTDFAVRAVSSNPGGHKAQALLAQHKDSAHLGRLTMVKCNLDDPDELREALKGVYGVFAAMPMGTELRGGEPVEVTQGKALIDACKTDGVEHLVYSSLPSVDKISRGKYKHVTHAESKATVSEYAQSQLPNVTLLYPGMFYSNFYWPTFAQREQDNSVRFCAPLRPDTPIQCVDDRYDVGYFAAAVFSAGPAATSGKTYAVQAPVTTPEKLAYEYHLATGEPTRFDPLPLDEAVAMMSVPEGRASRFIDDGVDGKASFSAGLDHDASLEDLGVRASDLQSFLERSGFRVGQKG
ncbi:uncharacterized protein RHOBADRAFT_44998 [Rhodotorula graminis WP1]|uniref:NmrA-like domain-containing protein n=1 Tax=Rhodotorula graminis (strain WP1) TaxID=578459 RepID=A0A194S1W9_RHOGW|nr:uncharacterized protein RHOBADRAFT_44998 [Rhodotorula graminis WP1]KPV74509.1 hypothetical protein RHOBADRAFT_44998 [Rhodotorula graminis WP1]